MYPTSTSLQAYAGFCPSCGSPLEFDAPTRVDDLEAVSGTCTKPKCHRKWSLCFCLDESGTFGVMSFQCDNSDRIM